MEYPEKKPLRARVRINDKFNPHMMLSPTGGKRMVSPNRLETFNLFDMFDLRISWKINIT